MYMFTTIVSPYSNRKHFISSLEMKRFACMREISLILSCICNNQKSCIKSYRYSYMYTLFLIWVFVSTVWLWPVYRCIEMVRSSVYAELASELEITKALTYLRLMDIPKVHTCITYIETHTCTCTSLINTLLHVCMCLQLLWYSLNFRPFHSVSDLAHAMYRP